MFCGAQAGAIAFGKEFSDGVNYQWVEELFDYERELGVTLTRRGILIKSGRRSPAGRRDEHVHRDCHARGMTAQRLAPTLPSERNLQ